MGMSGRTCGGVMTDGSVVTDYPIIGFTNYGDAARLRIWDADITDGWEDLDTSIAYDEWTSFSIDFTGTSFVYLVDGAMVYTDTTIDRSTGFSATIMQAYNFFGDTSLVGATLMDYTANWSNTSNTPVPEPGTMMLLGSGLVGLVGWGRKKSASKRYTIIAGISTGAAGNGRPFSSGMVPYQVTHAECDNLQWPHRDHLIWPHPDHASRYVSCDPRPHGFRSESSSPT
jgi:PEP-CTERM motif-containing protein